MNDTADTADTKQICAGEEYCTTISASNPDNIEVTKDGSFIDPDIDPDGDGKYKITFPASMVSPAGSTILIKVDEVVVETLEIIEC